MAVIAVGASFLAGIHTASALPNCQTCSCKEVFAWSVDNGTTVEGLRRDNPQGGNFEVRDGITSIKSNVCPDPPLQAQDGGADRYHYFNASNTCTPAAGQENDIREYSDSSNKQRVQIGINKNKCVGS
jgi:hypothetical protein